MSVATPKKIVFNSRFDHGVDDKRRLQIPSKWRTEEEGFEFMVILWPKHQVGPCLRVMPMAEYHKLAETIESLPLNDPKRDPMSRIVFGNAETVVLDKTGRVCLPERMAKEAGIKRDVVLVGMNSRFEIWDAERHKSVHASDDVHRPAVFENL
jgi:MraZ protein